MTGIYFRLLRQLDPAVLQDHCSNTFEEELGRIRVALVGLVEASERLKEVRDAAAKLDHRPARAGHAVVDSTAALWRTLSSEMQRIDDSVLARSVVRVSATRAAATITNKRKDPVDDDASTSTTHFESPHKRTRTSDTRRQSMDTTDARDAVKSEVAVETTDRTKEKKKKKRKLSVVKEREQEDEDEDFEDKRSTSDGPKEVSAATSTPPREETAIPEGLPINWSRRLEDCSRQAQKMSGPLGDLSKGTFDRLIRRVIGFIREVRDLPSSAVHGALTDDFWRLISSVGHLLDSPRLEPPPIGPIKAVLHAIKNVGDVHPEALPALQLSIDNFEKRLASKENSITPQGQMSTPSSTPTQPSEEIEQLLSRALEILKMPVASRRGRVVNITSMTLGHLKRTFPIKGKRAKLTHDQITPTAQLINRLISLIRSDPPTEGYLSVYKSYLNLLFAISDHYNNMAPLIAVGLDGLQAHLLPHKQGEEPTLGNNISSRKVETQPESRFVDRDDDGKLREEFKAAAMEARSWDPIVFALKDFDKVVRVLSVVVKSKHSSWNPFKDHRVLDLAQHLLDRTHAIKKERQREARRELLYGLIAQLRGSKRK